jgi:hypothetical protein
LGAGGAGCAAAGHAAIVNNAAVVFKRSFMDASLECPQF